MPETSAVTTPRLPRPHKGQKTRSVSTAPKEIADEICRRLVAGVPIETICSDPDMPSKPTLWRWRKNDPGLEHRIILALGMVKRPVKVPLDAPKPDTGPGPETWTPLAIMLTRMKNLWRGGEAGEDEQREAITIAEKAAPYVHPRLSAVDARITHRDLRDLGEDELLRELALLREQAGALLGHDAPRLPAVIDQLPEPEPEPEGEGIPDDNSQDC